MPQFFCVSNTIGTSINVFLDDEIAYECQRLVHAKQINLAASADRITRICELPTEFIG
jgi:hypothetical protein